MNVLAVDPGGHTGWVLRYRGAEHCQLEKGTEVFDLRRGESPGHRFLRFRAWLEGINTTCNQLTGRNVELVIYEQPHQRGGYATELLYGFTTRLVEAAAAWGAEHVAVHTSTLKKRVTGNGRASKSDMELAAFRKWSVTGADEHQSDALGLMQIACEDYPEGVVISWR